MGTLMALPLRGCRWFDQFPDNDIFEAHLHGNINAVSRFDMKPHVTA